MREKIKFIGAIVLLLVLVPYMVTLFFHDDAAGFLNKNDAASQLEEKVVQLVSEEVSGQAELEAIKAQAVIARTELYQNPEMEVSGNNANLEQNMETIKFCVEETEGQILTYEGKPIEPAFHAVSGKITRTGAEVLGQEDKSYLRTVDSSWDIGAPEYLTIIYMEKVELATKIQELLQDNVAIQVNPETILEDLIIESRDSAEYVTTVRYGDYLMNGEAVRDKLGLASSLFYLSELEGKVRIMTKGLGHGLGLSQYGANVMAAEGKKYNEILKYYYSGVEIEKVRTN